MLLIGSRAIRYHFPEFREPVDWDLVGTTDDLRRLDRVLARRKTERRVPAERLFKAHYLYEGTRVEVANADLIPYWRRVCEVFEDAPTFDAGPLGRVRVASPDYLLLTKQCGLVYSIAHWHKNLEDVYYLRDRIPRISDEVAALWPLCVADSHRMFEAGHRRTVRETAGCYPGHIAPGHAAAHRALHHALARRPVPWAEEPGAWLGFPELAPSRRRECMIRLFAEETMVVAGERLLEDRALGSPVVRDPEEYVRSSLRGLVVGALPMGWRYFGVNHYREIRAKVPGDWVDRLANLPASAMPRLEPCQTAAPTPASCSGNAS